MDLCACECIYELCMKANVLQLQSSTECTQYSNAVPSLVTDSGADDFSDCCCVALDPTAVATRNQEPAFPGHSYYHYLCSER